MRVLNAPAPVTVPNTTANTPSATGWVRRTIRARPSTTLQAETTGGGSQNFWSANHMKTPSSPANDTAIATSKARERRVGHAPDHQPRTRMATSL